MAGKRWWRITKKIILWIFVTLLVVLTGIALYNRTLPTASPVIETLSDDEVVRLKEATHLRKTLGVQVWPGWGALEIPLLVYNEEYAFLVGIDKPSTGWTRVPGTAVEGGDWKPVSGGAYHRQRLPENGPSPQAFIVRVGDRYAASMTTKDWTGVHFVEMMKEQLPGFLTPFMPYSLFLSQFTSEWHISALLHESFHVIQAREAYGRLNAAEAATALERDYPWEDDRFRGQWLEERSLLADAVRAEEPDRVRRLVGEWSALRRQRREGLTEELIRYEQQREWLEGLAKYAEMTVLIVADSTSGYRPLPEMDQDPDFNRYKDARNRWNRELGQLESDLQFSETIFYYSGWIQAALLDRLAPGWKDSAFGEDIYLDGLITNAAGDG